MRDLIRITEDVDKALVGKTIFFAAFQGSSGEHHIGIRFTDDTHVFGSFYIKHVINDKPVYGIDWECSIPPWMSPRLGITLEKLRSLERDRVQRRIEDCKSQMAIHQKELDRLNEAK